MAIVAPFQVKPVNAIADGSPLTGVRVGAVSPRFTTGGLTFGGFNFVGMPGANIAAGAALNSSNQVNVSGYTRFHVSVITTAAIAASKVYLGITCYDPITQTAVQQETPVAFPATPATWANAINSGTNITNITDINQVANAFKTSVSFGRDTANLPYVTFSVIGVSIINLSTGPLTFNAFMFVCSS